jgi:hypothetical protein
MVMTTDPTFCPKCGRPHLLRGGQLPSCSAHRKIDGGPCGEPPMKGQRVCWRHGGKKRAALVNAANRRAEAEADATVRRLYYDPSAPPLTDTGAALQRLAGALEQMIDRLARELDEGLEVSPDRLRAKALFWEKLLGHFRQLLVDIDRLRLGDRFAAVEEARAAVIVTAFFRALDAIGVDEGLQEIAEGVLRAELRRIAELEEAR